MSIFRPAVIQLFALTASRNGSQTVGGVFTLPEIEPNNCGDCPVCTSVDAPLYTDGTIFFASISELRSNALRCEVCRSIMILCPVQPSGGEDSLFVLASFEEGQPRLLIRYSDLNAQPWAGVNTIIEGVRQTPMSPRDLYFWEQSTSRNEQSGRPFRPEEVDLEVVRGWIRHCDSTHGDTCNSRSPFVVNAGLPFRPRLSFIDLEEECVVTPQTSVEYVALSYVWGRVETYKATTSNWDQLQQPGSLSLGSEHRVPRTIRDAMKLARSLRQQYLWVDALCIVQGGNNMQPHLDAMGLIYHEAYYTIVVANGDANMGIAGVGGNPQGLRNACHVLRFPTSTFTLNCSRGEEKLEASDWAWRAWTHQELMFSRRLLVVNGAHGLVSWKCQCAAWNEEVEEPSEHSENPIPGANTNNRVDTTGEFPLWPDLISYGEIVMSYTTKGISFEENVLDAFRGINTVMEHSFRCKFIYGLPEAFFDFALLWEADDGIRRRNPREGNAFPSWSWMGWVGRISYHIMESCAAEWMYHGQPIHTYSCVSWYLVSDPSQVGGFRDNHPDQQQEIRGRSVWTSLYLRNNLSEVQPGWTRRQDIDDPNSMSYFTHPSAPGAKFLRPVPSIFTYDLRDTANLTAVPGPYLRTRTEKVELRITNIEPPSERYVFVPYQQPFSTRTADLVDENGTLVGAIRIEVPDSDQSPSERPCTLIAISWSFCLESTDEWGDDNRGLPELYDERRPRTGEVYDFCNVLWIEWEDGIAYRKALGRVFAEAWERQRREWIDVVLG